MPCDIELHLTAQQPQPAVDLLQANCELSKNRLKQVMQCGAVWLSRGQQTKRLRRAKTELQVGDTLHLYYDAKTIDLQPPPAQLIADEGDYSVWYKPSGMFTQGTKWGDHHTIGRWAEQHLEPQRTSKIVHRLDRHTSGLILLAHSKKAAAELSRVFREREIEKHYQAIVVGTFGEQGHCQRIETDIDGKHALSDVTVLAVADGRSLLNVQISTGRKHQVRRHLSEAGFPIVGDAMFAEAAAEGLQLCAVKLAFSCPLSGQSRLYQTPQSLRPVFSV
jgi:tRNA pseudouridine32 synthase/23S rRNA pseudouridine746 synthase